MKQRKKICNQRHVQAKPCNLLFCLKIHVSYLDLDDVRVIITYNFGNYSDLVERTNSALAWRNKYEAGMLSHYPETFRFVVYWCGQQSLL